MHRLIARLLILTLLTLNIAWAADDCALIEPDDSSPMSVQAGDDLPINPPNTNFDCDDWCHAWVNHIALAGLSVTDGISPSTINSGGVYTLSYHSLTLPPPYHPPIV